MVQPTYTPRTSDAGDLCDVSEELEAVVGEPGLRGLPGEAAVPLNDEARLRFESETVRSLEGELVVGSGPASFARRGKLAEEVPEYAACFFQGARDPIHRFSAPRGRRRRR